MALLFPCRLFRAFVFLAILSWGIATVSAVHAAEGTTEYELKAVMLFNLARFVEWPSSAFGNSNSPIVIGIVGRDPFGDILDKAVQGETVNGRHIVIEHHYNPQAPRACHILFISSSEKSRLGLILPKLKGQPILSVSEIDGFTRLPGGMVRFYTNDQNKIRLRLNLESSRAEGLGISSKLIQVAELDKVSLWWRGCPSLYDYQLAASTDPSPILPFAR